MCFCCDCVVCVCRVGMCVHVCARFVSDVDDECGMCDVCDV